MRFTGKSALVTGASRPNNAGVFGIASMVDSDESFWDSMINVNVKGTYFCSRAALPALRTARGAIVNVVSEAGLNGASGMTVYRASKGAIVNLTRAMARVRADCASQLRLSRHHRHGHENHQPLFDRREIEDRGCCPKAHDTVDQRARREILPSSRFFLGGVFSSKPS
jgi:hypothetical protein